MPFFKFDNIKISAVSAAVPTEVVTVDSFADRFGEEYVAKFQESTGVREFRRTMEHQTASDLCFAAAENIIKKKNVPREGIGLLIFVAHSTDYRRPATACVLHKRLGLNKDCAAFDIALGCSAFVYGLQTACSMMASSNIGKALLLVGETLTKMVNPMDKSVTMLFGDGGAAILLEKTAEASNIYGLLKTDGSGYRAIIAPAGGFRNLNAPTEPMTWGDGNVRTLYNTTMQGEDVFAFTISAVPKTIKEFLSLTGTGVNDYDCLAFHQANQFIHRMMCRKLKVDTSRMPLCLDRFGNTSAPAIPMVMCDTFGDDDDDKELNFLMCGFGVGLSWGVCSARINVSDILPIIETDEIFEEGIINSPEDFNK
ncbi:MAG: ketoacyl-ACP synthase III [Bacteroides sp.]|nr:ketoacyl-ACP synthase III [Bacteroides sp.]